MKLLSLDVHHTLGDVERTEGHPKLRPSEAVSGGLQIEVTLPPRTGGILELMRGVENLLVLLAPNESELLLDGAEPVIGIEWILCPREDGSLRAQKIRVIVMTLGSIPTTGSRVLHENMEEFGLILTVALDLHEHFRHCRRWRWAIVRHDRRLPEISGSREAIR